MSHLSKTKNNPKESGGLTKNKAIQLLAQELSLSRPNQFKVKKYFKFLGYESPNTSVDQLMLGLEIVKDQLKEN